jgi:hypothetical protein
MLFLSIETLGNWEGNLLKNNSEKTLSLFTPDNQD